MEIVRDHLRVKCKCNGFAFDIAFLAGMVINAKSQLYDISNVGSVKLSYLSITLTWN